MAVQQNLKYSLHYLVIISRNTSLFHYQTCVFANIKSLINHVQICDIYRIFVAQRNIECENLFPKVYMVSEPLCCPHYICDYCFCVWNINEQTNFLCVFDWWGSSGVIATLPFPSLLQLQHSTSIVTSCSTPYIAWRDFLLHHDTLSRSMASCSAITPHVSCCGFLLHHTPSQSSDTTVRSNPTSHSNLGHFFGSCLVIPENMQIILGSCGSSNFVLW